MSTDTFLIVTAHNEAEWIAATLAALDRAFPEAALYVADDGSSDATAVLAREAGAHVVRSERVIGKGGAATLAARRALADRDGSDDFPVDAGGVVYVLCDGDLGDSAAALRALADAVRRGEADVAVAAFKTRVGGGFGLARGFARWAIRRRCGLDTRAPISGQRALTARALADVVPFARGFGMEMGMTIDAVGAGHRVLELELELEHRASGRTVAGFAHRAVQLADFVRVYMVRGRLARR